MALFVKTGCPEHGPDIRIESFHCDGVTLTLTCTVSHRDEIQVDTIRAFVFPVPTTNDDDEGTEDPEWDTVFRTLLGMAADNIAELLQEEIQEAMNNMAGPN